MHTVYSTAEMKEALCEGNAGGSDQMGSNDELEEVKCNDVARISTKRTVNTCQRAPDLGEGSSRVHA